MKKLFILIVIPFLLVGCFKQATIDNLVVQEIENGKTNAEDGWYYGDFELDYLPQKNTILLDSNNYVPYILELAGTRDRPKQFKFEHLGGNSYACKFYPVMDWVSEKWIYVEVIMYPVGSSPEYGRYVNYNNSRFIDEHIKFNPRYFEKSLLEHDGMPVKNLIVFRNPRTIQQEEFQAQQQRQEYLKRQQQPNPNVQNTNQQVVPEKQNPVIQETQKNPIQEQPKKERPGYTNQNQDLDYKEEGPDQVENW